VGEGQAGERRVNPAGPAPVWEASLASLAATGRFAARLAAAIDAVTAASATRRETLWIGLLGEVGAGKTTLTARLVPALQKLGWASDGAEEVASPTYAIEHSYLRGALPTSTGSPMPGCRSSRCSTPPRARPWWSGPSGSPL
jgi:hypothetical protein